MQSPAQPHRPLSLTSSPAVPSLSLSLHQQLQPLWGSPTCQATRSVRAFALAALATWNGLPWSYIADSLSSQPQLQCHLHGEPALTPVYSSHSVICYYFTPWLNSLHSSFTILSFCCLFALFFVSLHQNKSSKSLGVLSVLLAAVI